MEDAWLTQPQALVPQGFLARIVHHRFFEALSLVVVTLASLWIIVEVDVNPSEDLLSAPMAFQIIAHAFCAFFFVEVILRFFAFERWSLVHRDFRFLFDTLLMLLMVIETWMPALLISFGVSLSRGVGVRAIIVLRMLRIFRILRLARLMQAVPELMIIACAIARSFRAIWVIMAMHTLFIYISAVVMRILASGTNLGKEHFSTVFHAMGTLLLDCTLSGARGGPIMRAAHDESFVFAGLIFGFVLVGNITMMGMFTGVLVQSIRTTADKEKEAVLIEKVHIVMDAMWQKATEQDVDRDGLVNEEELGDLIDTPDFSVALQSLDVDPEAFSELSGFMYRQCGADQTGGLRMIDLKRMVLDLRGKQVAKVKHHIETRKLICSYLDELMAACPGIVQAKLVPDGPNNDEGHVSV